MSVQRVLKCHPDKTDDPVKHEEVHVLHDVTHPHWYPRSITLSYPCGVLSCQFRQITFVYDVLSDPKRLAVYNE